MRWKIKYVKPLTNLQMKAKTKESLYMAWAICDEEDKSTEYTLQFMADSAEVEYDTAVNFMMNYGGAKRAGWYKEKNQRVKYSILSPDGISIEYDTLYDSPEEAWIAFDKWAKRYQKQGYYSSNDGAIKLEDLKSECTLKTIF